MILLENYVAIMIDSVLLDTSFLSGLVNQTDTHHENAKKYWKYLLDEKVILYFSSIVASEITTIQELSTLPFLHSCRPIVFNLRDAATTGKITRYKIWKQGSIKGSDTGTRVEVKDDLKILSQLFTYDIDAIATGDTKMNKVFDVCCQCMGEKKVFIDINRDYRETFGLPNTLFEE